MTYRKREILHHAPHPAHIPRASVPLALTCQEILDAAVGVDLHSAQVVEAVDETGLLAKLLAEGVAKVVGRVGRDEQHGASHLGQLDGERARGGCLAHAALAADKDPAQRPLVEDGLERRLHGIRVVGVDDSGRHCGGFGMEMGSGRLGGFWSDFAGLCVRTMVRANVKARVRLRVLCRVLVPTASDKETLVLSSDSVHLRLWKQFETQSHCSRVQTAWLLWSGLARPCGNVTGVFGGVTARGFRRAWHTHVRSAGTTLEPPNCSRPDRWQPSMPFAISKWEELSHVCSKPWK